MKFKIGFSPVFSALLTALHPVFITWRVSARVRVLPRLQRLPTGQVFDQVVPADKNLDSSARLRWFSRHRVLPAWEYPSILTACWDSQRPCLRLLGCAPVAFPRPSPSPKGSPVSLPGSLGTGTLPTASVPSPAPSLSRLERSARPTSLPVCCPSVEGQLPKLGLPPCLETKRPPVRTPGLWHLVPSPETSGHRWSGRWWSELRPVLPGRRRW